MDKKLLKPSIYIIFPIIISTLFDIFFYDTYLSFLSMLILSPMFVYGFYRIGKYVQELNDYNNKFTRF